MQSSLIVRPAWNQNPLVIRPFTQGVWTQLTTTDQTTNTINDPGTNTTGTTGLANGLFTWQTKNAAVPVFDGLRENLPGWTKNLRSIYTDFDPATDMLDLRLDIVSCPMNTGRYGLVVGVMDNVIANRASWNGSALYVAPTAATTWAGGQLGNAASASVSGVIGTNTNPVVQLFARSMWTSEDSTVQARCMGQVSRTGVDEIPLVTLDTAGPTMSAVPSNWVIFVALAHFAAVDATDNVVSCRVYHRRVRAGSFLA